MQPRVAGGAGGSMSIDKLVLKTRQGGFSHERKGRTPATGENSQESVSPFSQQWQIYEVTQCWSRPTTQLRQLTGAVGVLSSTPDQDQSNSSSRSRQCQSRSSEQGEVRPDRVQASSRSVSADQPSVRSSHNRPDGRSAEYSVAEIHLSFSGSSKLWFSTDWIF